MMDAQNVIAWTWTWIPWRETKCTRDANDENNKNNHSMLIEIIEIRIDYLLSVGAAALVVCVFDSNAFHRVWMLDDDLLVKVQV